MAIRYFDGNGTTAGFGTLTGNWNSTGPTVGWSSSAAGTGAVGAYTFTSADEAVFGVAGQTATGGTVTIPTGLNVTLNKITTANISGQTIDYGGTGTLTFAGTNPTINDNSPLTISVPLAGTGGVTKVGTANPLRIKVPGTISGTYAQTSGLHTWAGAEPSALGPTANVFPNITDFNIQAGIYYIWNSNNAGYTYAGQFRGAGFVLLTQANTTNAASNTIAFPSLQNWTGTFLLWSNSTTANRYAFASVALFPTSASADMQYKHEDAGGAVSGIEKWLIIPSSATGHSTPTKITLYTTFNQPISSTTYRLNANQTSTGSNGMTFSGAVQRIDGATGYTSIGTLTLTLGGTNTDANTISGVISSAAGMGALAIAKADNGLWVLSNANTYSNGTTISGGELRGANTSAFSTGSITVNTGTVLSLSGGVSPVNSITATSATIRSVSGSNTLATSAPNSIVLVTAATFDASSGATLNVSPVNAISGPVPVTFSGDGNVAVSGQFSNATSFAKTGNGTTTLSNTSNVFSGAGSISGGTLSVPAISCLGAGAGLTLSNAGTLKYTGTTGDVLSRSISTSSLSGGGFENDSNANLTVASGTITGTLKLGGSGTGQFNTLNAVVSAGGNAFTKTGAGRWIYTGTNVLTGTTSVTATATTGTLMAAPSAATTNARLLGATVNVGPNAGIQIGSDNNQQGRNRYTNLTVTGSSTSARSRIRLGGSAVSPTVQMSGNLTINSGTTWDVSADVFKTPGQYTLIEFTGSGALVGGAGSLANVTTLIKPTGFETRTYTLGYSTTPINKITLTIS